MKLRDWLLKKGLRQKEFAEIVQVERCHLSSVINKNRNPGKKLAKRIEESTNGAIKAEDILSGKALGYEGESKRVKAIYNSVDEYYNSQKRFSFL
jgi:transcriptional regulator with XRE-family HTH domain